MTKADLDQYQGLVIHMVEKLRRRVCKHVLWEDALQTGYLALVSALQTHDPNLGEFPSYLFATIRNQLYEEGIRARMIRVPSSAWRKETARGWQCGIAAQTVERMSIFTQYNLPSQDEREAIDLRIDTENLLRCLTPSERTLVREAYGIGGQRKTLQEIGSGRGASRQAIDKQHRRMLGRLREQIQSMERYCESVNKGPLNRSEGISSPTPY